MTKLLNRITEKQFLSQVDYLAKNTGWLTYHTWNSQHSAGGFPDLCMVRGNRLIFTELKSEVGKVTPEQINWLCKLGQTIKPEVYLWRPSDWDRIVEKLKEDSNES